MTCHVTDEITNKIFIDFLIIIIIMSPIPLIIIDRTYSITNYVCNCLRIFSIVNGIGHY
jgi:hypothetical protein